MLKIDPNSPGIVKINHSTGRLQDALDQKVPDGSTIDFLSLLGGG
jgi:hypothetical protein